MASQPASDYTKFCPGEEHFKISNAVCRGRRRASFPKCKGCQFNDDERAAAAMSAHATQQAASNGPTVELVKIRRENRVIQASEQRHGRLEPLFRSSDIRGKAPAPLTVGAAWRIGLATAQFLRSKLKGIDRADPRARSVVIGRDARPESIAVASAVCEGIRAAGATVYDIGLVDTPQVCFGVRHFSAGGGVMVTGGRSPAGFSGLKLCGLHGRDMSATTGLIDICDIASRLPRHETGTSAPHYQAELDEPYRQFIRRALGVRFARPLRVVVDANNGAAARWIPRLFGDIENLTVLLINDHAGPPFAHDPDPGAPRAMALLRQAVKRESADLGVCFDPDADACYFVDERGMLVRPDYVVALMARQILERSGTSAVVVDRRCSRMVFEEIERIGGVALPERPDSAQIKKAMNEKDAVLGALLSGQFFFAENEHSESAMLTLAHMLHALASNDATMSQRVRPLARYKNTRVRPFHIDNIEKALSRVAKEYGKLAQSVPRGLKLNSNDWWCHLDRLGGDDELGITMEARTAERLKQKTVELVRILRSSE